MPEKNQRGGGRDAVTFSPAQREAVTWGQGPLLVLAGPGSGKTFVITQRVRWLTEEKGVLPGHILVVTFSRAAAREMEERYLAMTASSPGTAPGGAALSAASRRRGKVTFGTFHSFFFGILRTAYGYSADQVAGEEERKDIVFSLIKENRMESEDIRSLAQNLISEIALVKEERAELSHYYSVTCPAEQFREIFRGYEKALGLRKKIDYEDMLLMTYELLSQRPDIRAAVQERWQWVLVDEFQDINRLQYEIVRMIAGERKNLTIVGDDDQSIYRFRGAKPEIMLGFEKDYPGAKRVLLDINFRSTPEIVKTAGRLIRKNKERFDKKITAARPSGKPVNTVVFPDTAQQALWIAREIRKRVREGMQYSDIAVLYRTNLQPRLITAKLMAENVPFRMREMLPDLMDHWIARDVSAYLRLARGTGEPGDLLRIMNRPNRYIRREALRRGGETLEGIRKYYAGSDQSWMRERIDGLQRELKILSRMNVYEAIKYLRQEIGYEKFLKEYAEAHFIEPPELLEIMDEIQESAEGFRLPEEWFSHMKEFREELLRKKERRPGASQGGAASGTDRNGEASGAAGDGPEDEDQVRLMTFHAAKGLEFPLVFIIDVNEGVVPHRKAGSRPEREEERRMFYVAMTRARDELIVCTCKKRFRREAEESPFIAEYEK